MKKDMILGMLFLMTIILIGIVSANCDLSDISSCDDSCQNNYDCKFVATCHCLNVKENYTNINNVHFGGADCGGESCVCIYNKCQTGYAPKGYVCGNGVCENITCAGNGCYLETKANCPKDCNNSTNSCLKEGESGVCGRDKCCSGLKEECSTTNSVGAVASVICTRNNLVGNDSDSHGCKGSAGYSWCEEKKKCLRSWEENCSDKKICPSIGIPNCPDRTESEPILDEKNCINGYKCILYSGPDNKIKMEIKVMPETASQKAIERLGELGFNVTLKSVGNKLEWKSFYEVSGVKEGKMFGLFKVHGKVSAEVDAQTGEVLKVHKPWWGFIAGL